MTQLLSAVASPESPQPYYYRNREKNAWYSKLPTFALAQLVVQQRILIHSSIPLIQLSSRILEAKMQRWLRKQQELRLPTYEAISIGITSIAVLKRQVHTSLPSMKTRKRNYMKF